LLCLYKEKEKKKDTPKKNKEMPTDGNRTGETTSYNKVYDKVIDTDSTSYIITSNVITSSLKPSCDIVENYTSHKRPRDNFCDTININITTSDISIYCIIYLMMRAVQQAQCLSL
jgi:hypothetical protein